MTTIRSYLLFQSFIMPIALQFLFWAGIAGTLYGATWLYLHDHWAWPVALIFGVVLTRLIFESFILRYRAYMLLTDIKARLDER